jgi:uncharacterized protein GlcG (DUF336 family)
MSRKEKNMEEEKFKRQWPPDLPYDYSAMDLEKALIMIEAAKEKAKKMGFSMTLAVCDAGGNLTALHRMDDAPLLSLEIAINKTRTAIMGKIPTDRWGAFFKGTDPMLSPLFFHTGWITFGGGFPVILKGKIIGGFGCSGATWEDCVIARAGLIAIGADLSGVESFLKDSGVLQEMW